MRFEKATERLTQSVHAYRVREEEAAKRLQHPEGGYADRIIALEARVANLERRLR